MANFNPFVDQWPGWLKVGVLAGGLGIELLSMRRWAGRALASDDERATPQFMDMWLWIMRPGNILILVGAGLFVYDFLHGPPFYYVVRRFAEFAIALGFILRHWGWWTNAG